MNDRERFEALAALVLEPLQRYVGRRCPPHDAPDVVNDVLLVLWRRLDDVPAGAEVPWTYGVARRCIANVRRGDRRRDALDARLRLQWPAAEADVDGSEQVVERDRIATALGALGELDAEVVRLWAWEGLEPREIALVVDLTANAVSIRLHRARRALATRLGSERQDAAAAGHLRGEPDDRREEAP